MTPPKRRLIELAQCEEAAFVDGEAVEVAVHEEGEPVRYYLVGAEAEHGETMIAPLTDGLMTSVRWQLADYTVLDAIEHLQSHGVCDSCDGSGRVERQPVGLDARGGFAVDDCEDCDGEGWR